MAALSFRPKFTQKRTQNQIIKDQLNLKFYENPPLVLEI